MSLISNDEFGMVKHFSEDIQRLLTLPPSPSSNHLFVELQSIIKLVSGSSLQLLFKSHALKIRMTHLTQRVKQSFEHSDELCNLLSKVNKAAIFYLLSKNEKKESQFKELKGLIENPMLLTAPLLKNFEAPQLSKEKTDLLVRALSSTINELFKDVNDQEKLEAFKIRMENMLMVFGKNPSEDIPWKIVEKITAMNDWVLNIFHSNTKKIKTSPKEMVGRVDLPATNQLSVSSPCVKNLTQSEPLGLSLEKSPLLQPDFMDNNYRNPLQAIIDSEVSFDALEAVRFKEKDRSETDPSRKTKNRMKSSIEKPSKKRKKHTIPSKKEKAQRQH